MAYLTSIYDAHPLLGQETAHTLGFSGPVAIGRNLAGKPLCKASLINELPHLAAGSIIQQAPAHIAVGKLPGSGWGIHEKRSEHIAPDHIASDIIQSWPEQAVKVYKPSLSSQSTLHNVASLDDHSHYRRQKFRAKPKHRRQTMRALRWTGRRT